MGAERGLLPSVQGAPQVRLLWPGPSSCIAFYTDSEEKVWEGCDKMSKGLEGPKSHDTLRSCPSVEGLSDGVPRVGAQRESS